MKLVNIQPEDPVLHLLTIGGQITLPHLWVWNLQRPAGFPINFGQGCGRALRPHCLVTEIPDPIAVVGQGFPVNWFRTARIILRGWLVW